MQPTAFGIVNRLSARRRPSHAACNPALSCNACPQCRIDCAQRKAGNRADRRRGAYGRTSPSRSVHPPDHRRIAADNCGPRWITDQCHDRRTAGTNRRVAGAFRPSSAYRHHRRFLRVERCLDRIAVAHGAWRSTWNTSIRMILDMLHYLPFVVVVTLPAGFQPDGLARRASCRSLCISFLQIVFLHHSMHQLRVRPLISKLLIDRALGFEAFPH